MAGDNPSDEENEPRTQEGTQIQWNLQTTGAKMTGATEQNRLNEQRSVSQQATSTEAVRTNNVATSAAMGLPERRVTESNGAVGHETGTRSRVQQADSSQWDFPATTIAQRVQEMQRNYERLNVRDAGNAGGRRPIPVETRDELLNNLLPKKQMKSPGIW